MGFPLAISEDTLTLVQALLSLGALLGVAVALVYQARMATHAASANIATVYQNIAQQMHEINLLFVEKPELKRFFYEGAPLPDDGLERIQILSIAEAIVDFMDNFVTQSPFLKQDLVVGWEDYFCDLYRRSPAIQTYWAERGPWYATNMHDLVARADAQGA
jgi:hypothetical protein